MKNQYVLRDPNLGITFEAPSEDIAQRLTKDGYEIVGTANEPAEPETIKPDLTTEMHTETVTFYDPKTVDDTEEWITTDKVIMLEDER